MKKRKCEECGYNLTDKDVMKMKFENGTYQVIPLKLCPVCFTKQMAKKAQSRTL